MSVSEKFGILHAIYVEHRLAADVAKEYRVSTSCVLQLMFKSRRKPKFLDELRAHEQAKTDTRAKIAAFIEQKN